MQPQASSYNLDFGREGYGNYAHYRGTLDDIRIYTRALLDSEVRQLYAYESQACIPRPATATLQIVNSFVVGATITDPGWGYTNPPYVQIMGSGTGAKAYATVTQGSISKITVTDAGTGYSTNTSIRIASPPFSPWLETVVSKMKVTMHLVLGKNYVLESSKGWGTWTQVGTNSWRRMS